MRTSNCNRRANLQGPGLPMALLIAVWLGSPSQADDEKHAATAPSVLEHVVVYREPGRFAGWPANHGIWSWGDEVLVGFSRGYYKDLGDRHHIDREKPEDYLLARSLDGGKTWAVEVPQPPGALVGTSGMRHGVMPPGVPDETLIDLAEPIDFTHPDFAMTLRMADANGGVSRWYYSYDRGRTWRGPHPLPLFGQPGVMARTDYVVNGPRDCHIFATASKQSNGREGRPFCARTRDGGLTWEFLSFIGPEPDDGYAIMPGTVRVGPTDLVTTIRRRDSERSWIDAYASHDDGRSWTFLGEPEPSLGAGNPPSLVRLPDGRLALITAHRAEPYSIRARLSQDNGRTWSDLITLRDDGGGTDIGYVRSVVRPDGTILSVYYYHDRTGPDRYLAGTIWDPGKP
ncbi:sialidase family protein [Tautonia marina]|uniref:sialidase family protein n=1 Tax=Tautonia marina TaxID=2653855 RepID=UPI001260A002|nr:sialidase family protein [Tautonia marina]